MCQAGRSGARRRAPGAARRSRPAAFGGSRRRARGDPGRGRRGRHRARRCEALAAAAGRRSQPGERARADTRHARRPPCALAARLPPGGILDLAPLAPAVREGDTDTALALAAQRAADRRAFPRKPARSAAGAPRTPARALARAGRCRRSRRRAGAGRPPAPADRACAKARRARAASTRASRKLLAGSHASRRRHAGLYFHGRLLLVTENSYRHRLFNGDIGICLRDDKGALVAWFPGERRRRRAPFHPAALPAHESAFAMTVHKAQGSEFDRCGCSCRARQPRAVARAGLHRHDPRAERVACGGNARRDRGGAGAACEPGVGVGVEAAIRNASLSLGGWPMRQKLLFKKKLSCNIWTSVIAVVRADGAD